MNETCTASISQENLDVFDRNKDGKVTLEEYLGTFRWRVFFCMAMISSFPRLLRLVFVTKRLHKLFNGALVCPSSGVPGYCDVLLGKTLRTFSQWLSSPRCMNVHWEILCAPSRNARVGGKIYDAGGQHNSFFTACYDKRSRTAGAKLFLRNYYILNDHSRQENIKVSWSCLARTK